MHEVAQSCNPLLHTLMFLTEGRPHAVCWEVESLLTCQLHHHHGIRKTLVYDNKGQEGCITPVRKAAK